MMGGGGQEWNQPLPEPPGNIVRYAPAAAELSPSEHRVEVPIGCLSLRVHGSNLRYRSMLPLDQAAINIQLPKLMPFFRILQHERCAKCIHLVLTIAQLF